MRVIIPVMIKYTTIQKILKSERFAINLLIIGIFFSLISIVIISIYSKISPAIPTVENLKQFLIYYDFPIKIIAVTLTVFGILIVYHTYFQTKEQFIILNKAWISSKIAFRLIPHEENINSEKPILLFEIENIGNTPAEKFQADININPSNIFNFDIKNQVPKILLPKEAYTFIIEMGTKTFEYKEILKSKPFFDINVKINYSTFDENILKIDETYKFIYPNQPFVIKKEVIQTNKDGEIIKLS